MQTLEKRDDAPYASYRSTSLTVLSWPADDQHLHLQWRVQFGMFWCMRCSACNVVPLDLLEQFRRFGHRQTSAFVWLRSPRALRLPDELGALKLGVLSCDVDPFCTELSQDLCLNLVRGHTRFWLGGHGDDKKLTKSKITSKCSMTTSATPINETHYARTQKRIRKHSAPTQKPTSRSEVAKNLPLLKLRA